MTQATSNSTCSLLLLMLSCMMRLVICFCFSILSGLNYIPENWNEDNDHDIDRCDIGGQKI